MIKQTINTLTLLIFVCLTAFLLCLGVNAQENENSAFSIDSAVYTTTDSQTSADGDISCLHINVTEKESVLPTCTTPGLTEGLYCSDCGKVLKEQQVAERTEHTYKYGVVVKVPTCRYEGKIKYTCTVCKSAEKTETLKANGKHIFDEVITSPTCTEKGYTTYKCKICSYSYSVDETNPLGHKTDSGKITKEPSYGAVGIKTYCCTVCRKVIDSEELDMLTPGKVKGLKASANKTASFKLSWNKVKGAEKYRVYYSTDGKKWSKAETSKTSITLKKLKSGTKYKVKVKAFAGENKGSSSKTVETATKPKKVTLKALKSSKKKQASVNWKTVSSATGYEVLYSVSKKFSKETTGKLTLKKAKTKKATVKKLTSGDKYFVKVRAYKTVNGKRFYGAYSKVKTVKIK